MKVTTFNLLNYLEPPNACYESENIYSDSEWQRKQRWIKARLQEENADIIGFQEVFSPSSLKALVQDCGYPFFVTVEKPEHDGYIYTKPVLAVASKHPIATCDALRSDPYLLDLYPQLKEVEFSRAPIHLSVNVPEYGVLDIINVHLKSQRQTAPNPLINQDEFPLETKNIGRWLSAIQRGYEATLLYQYLYKLKAQKDRAVILLGDFNQTLEASETKVLLETSEENAPILFDGWELYCDTFGEEKQNLHWSREPTHFHGAIGKVLDYILLTDDFDSKNSHSRFNILDYTVYNKHLVSPVYEMDGYSSDHAIVSIKIDLRKA